MILSSNPDEYLLSEIKKYRLEGLFNEVNGSIHNKTEAIIEILERNGFNSKETAFVGDTTHEVDAGRHASVKTIAVTWGYQNLDKLKLANPDFLVHSIDELEKVLLV